LYGVVSIATNAARGKSPTFSTTNVQRAASATDGDISDSGNYTNADVGQAAINAAQETANDGAAAQEEINQAYAELDAALQAFRSKVIVRMPEDLNGDGSITIGDLAIVARYYGKTSADANWNTTRIADLNNDGKIDIADLSMVARKIFQSR